MMTIYAYAHNLGGKRVATITELPDERFCVDWSISGVERRATVVGAAAVRRQCQGLKLVYARVPLGDDIAGEL